MKTRLNRSVVFIAALISLASLPSGFAQGTAFSYNGKLNSGNAPANGLFDVRFWVYDSTNIPGSVIAGPLTNTATGVTNGLFTVTLDFGLGVFTGPARWLQLDVRTNGGGAFTTLSPRQLILPTPYAMMANTASNLLGNVPVAQVTGTVPLAQLPAAVVTNNQPGVVFAGIITATNISASANQNISVLGSSGSSVGGNVTIASGNAGIPTGGSGGNLNLQAGNAMASGGSGYGGLGAAGAVNIAAGNGYNSTGGNVILSSGGNTPWNLTANSFSKVSLQGVGFNSGDGAVVDVEGGHNTLYGSPPQYSSGGNVRIAGGSATGAYPGGNIFLLPGVGTPGGNVGIGTVSPSAKLHIGGGTRFTTADIGSLFLQSGTGGSGAARDWKMYVPMPAGNLAFRDMGFDNQNNGMTNDALVIQYGTGNVGIGRTNPATALDVNGTVTATAFSGNGAGLTNLSVSTVGTNVALLNGTNTFTGTNTFNNLTANGAVGIGVAANTATVLHVVSPNANAKILFESSVANGNPALVVKANSPAGEADIVTDRADTGASSAHNFLTGGVMDWTLRTPNFTTGEPSRLDLANAASTPVMTFHQSGNIGIGKPTAATALDVNGTVTATAFSGNGAGLTNLSVSTVGTNVALLNGTNVFTGTNTFSSLAGNGGGLTNLNASQLASGAVPDVRLSANVPLLNAANTFSANQTVNGAVGIGVAANAATVLHVVSPNANAKILFESSVANGNPALIVKANSPAGEADVIADRADTGASATHQFATGGNLDWRFGTPNFTSGEPNRLDIGNSNSTPVMTLRQNGNVGIGTTAAATALQVVGTVTATAFSGSGSGLTSVPLASLQSGGAANAQILTWNGTSWAASNAPAGGGGSGLPTSGGSGTNETFYGTTTFNGPVTGTNISSTTANLWLLGSSGSSVGGNINITGGNAGVPTGGSGGNLNLTAGNAMAAGGSGYTGLGPAGSVNITAGSGYNNQGGDVNIQSGPNGPWVLTGNSFTKVALRGGILNSNDNAAIEIESGHNTTYGSPPQNSAGGNVRILGGSSATGFGGGNILLLPGTGATNGFVGIGKTNPATMLDVNGIIKATSFTGIGSGLTNIPVSAITGGMTTNIPVLVAGNKTNTLVFVNGILTNVQ